MLQSIKGSIARYTARWLSISMWEKRAQQHGKHAVLNLGHTADEMDTITKYQWETISPILNDQLLGNEETILDLGCGPGRFTSQLAEMIHGKAIGVDPIQSFLDLAPKRSNLDYYVMKKGIIPVKDETIDVVWICLVLGGILLESKLRKMAKEINRVLKPNGLIVLTENTTDKPDGTYWKFRSVYEYQRIFKFAQLKHYTDYEDLGERISIMAGRKVDM